MLSRFIGLDNIQLLWDIITNDDFFKQYNQQIVSNIFYNNIQGFYKSEREKFSDLTTMNKMYILLITRYVKKNCVPIPKIHITNEQVDIFGELEMEGNTESLELLKPIKKKVVWREDVKDKTRLDQLEQELNKVKQDVARLMRAMNDLV